jgi:hypothetical protein
MFPPLFGSSESEAVKLIPVVGGSDRLHVEDPRFLQPKTKSYMSVNWFAVQSTIGRTFQVSGFGLVVKVISPVGPLTLKDAVAFRLH